MDIQEQLLDAADGGLDRMTRSEIQWLLREAAKAIATLRALGDRRPVVVSTETS